MCSQETTDLGIAINDAEIAIHRIEIDLCQIETDSLRCHRALIVELSKLNPDPTTLHELQTQEAELEELEHVLMADLTVAEANLRSAQENYTQYFASNQANFVKTFVADLFGTLALFFEPPAEDEIGDDPDEDDSFRGIFVDFPFDPSNPPTKEDVREYFSGFPLTLSDLPTGADIRQLLDDIFVFVMPDPTKDTTDDVDDASDDDPDFSDLMASVRTAIAGRNTAVREFFDRMSTAGSDVRGSFPNAATINDLMARITRRS